MARKKEYDREIRIRGASIQLKTDIENIADNVGVPMSVFLKTKLNEIAAGYPQHMKTKRPASLS